MDYNQLADKDIVSQTAKNLQLKGYQVFIVNSGNQALGKIMELIPENASVMNGTSVTLEQIGYLDFLESGLHKWNDLHAKVNAENDPEKRNALRREAALSDFYLGSVHALSQSGEFIIASNTASQLPHIAFTSPNLIFVVSTKKIVPDIPSGLKRLEDHVFPLENERMKKLYKVGTNINKILIFRGEAKYLNRKITLILVNENLGF